MSQRTHDTEMLIHMIDTLPHHGSLLGSLYGANLSCWVSMAFERVNYGCDAVKWW
jgi:hypothetical protein